MLIESDSSSSFHRVAIKIGLIKELRGLVEDLPLVTPGQPSSLVAIEAYRFQSFSNRVAKYLPTAEVRATALADLGRMTDSNGITFADKREQILLGEVDPAMMVADPSWHKFNRWMDDPDVRFVIGMKRGVESAQESRGNVRRLLGELGANWNNPDSYNRYIPEDYAALRGRVTKVRPLKFAIALFGSDAVFSELFNIPIDLGESLTMDFVSLSNPLFGLVKERPFTLKFFEEGGPPPPEIQAPDPQTLLNDLGGEMLTELDFRSLVDEFRLDAQTPYPYFEAIQRKLASLKFARLINAGSLRPQLLRDLRGDFARFTDSHHEEFLGEFVISPIKRALFKIGPFGGTYASLLLKRQLLAGLDVGRDPTVARMVEEAQSQTDFSALHRRVKRLINAVQIAAPERLADLEAAFMLFPPSQLPLFSRYVPTLITGS